MNPKIGYLIPEFPSQTHAFFWREVEALRASGESVRLFSTRRPAPENCRHAFAPEATAQTTYLLPLPAFSALRMALRRPGGLLRSLRYVASLKESGLWRKLKTLAYIPCAAGLAEQARADGVTHLHVHSCANSAHLAAMANRISGLPYSLSLHGDLQVYGVDHRAKMQRAAFIAPVTFPLKRQVTREIGIPVHKIPVIRMGVNSDAFKPGPVKTQRNHLFRLVTVARLNPQKGHRYALQAIRALLDKGYRVEYTIVGEGPERSRLERQVHELGLEAVVTFTGTQGEAEVCRLMQRADGFLLTSFGLGEAAPVSVMEAMACGLVPVCSRIGGTPELISHGVDGFLVPQKDAAAITHAVERLILEPDARREMADAARKRAEEQFDYRLHAARLRNEIRRNLRPAAYTPSQLSAHRPAYQNAR